MGLPARAIDREVDDLRKRLTKLPADHQARVLDGVLTPGLRLRVLAAQVRRQVGKMSPSDEAKIEYEIDKAVKNVRRSNARGR